VDPMQDFLIQSLIASVVLTVLINVLPRLMPKASRKIEKNIHDKIERAFAEDDERVATGNKPRVRVFFPWKAMLVVSIVVTVLVNLIGLIAR